MAKNYYLPRDDSGKAQLLEHLARRLPAYAETLEVSAADIASLQADAEAFRHAIASTDSIQANARQWTAYKNLQRDGGVRVNPRPQLPHLPVPARDVAPGIVPRLIALVSRLKTAHQYNEAIGHDLQIIGPEQRVTPTTGSPSWTPAAWPANRSSSGPRATPTPSKSGPIATTARASVSPPSPAAPTTPTPPTPPPARSGNTRPSTASATPRSASGAAW
jgi:hypothetical protein